MADCVEETCGADPDQHQWWVSCVELASPCGCTGDERPIAVAALGRAA